MTVNELERLLRLSNVDDQVWALDHDGRRCALFVKSDLTRHVLTMMPWYQAEYNYNSVPNDGRNYDIYEPRRLLKQFDPDGRYESDVSYVINNRKLAVKLLQDYESWSARQPWAGRFRFKPSLWTRLTDRLKQLIKPIAAYFNILQAPVRADTKENQHE